MSDTRHSVVGEGTDVGILGGLVVAVWFLLLDSLAGHPLQTPSLLGQVVLFGDATPDTHHLVFGAIILYTAFHFLVFAVLGVALTAVVHLAVREAVARYALVPLFLAFEVMFYGLLGILLERTNDLFPFWAVVSANTLAAVAMGYFLWIRHPDLRRSIRETPLGDAPMR
jgi:hypothetical protein